MEGFSKRFDKKIMNKSARYLFILILTISSGCSNLSLFKAFKGKFSVNENNKIINDYCTGCHTHNNFFPGNHVQKVKKLYKRDIYKHADECRVCHYLKKTLSGDIIEKTVYPQDFNST